MRKLFTLKSLFLAAVFMLLGCLSIQAADDDLITQQITIKLEKAGTLPDKIGSTKKYKITNLKIIGEVNGTDWRLIRDMAGRDKYEASTQGKLSTLDLSEAKIVSGGDYYYYNYHDGKFYSTVDDKIGGCAFYDCSSLTSIVLPASVTSIGDYAFLRCSGLTSIDIPSDVTSIGRSAFAHCSGLTSIDIPSNVTSIGNYAFYGCSGLASIVIPSGVTSIGYDVFYGCSGLASIDIPSSVTSIGDYAFYGCSGLASIVIPSSVTFIGSDVFKSCSNLKNVRYQIVDDIETYLTKGHPYIGVKCGIEYYLNDKKITSLVIPSTITKLGEYAFQKCGDLTSVYVSWQSPISAPSAFSGADISKCTLYVPQGSWQDYWLAEGWGDFGNIVEYDVTGISNVTTSADAKEVSRYSMDGQRLSAPAKGLNIVKYNDGSVKKVVVQ